MQNSDHPDHYEIIEEFGMEEIKKTLKVIICFVIGHRWRSRKEMKCDDEFRKMWEPVKKCTRCGAERTRL